MRRLTMLVVVLGVVLWSLPAWGAECKEVYGAGAVELRLATGSPGELGLVEVLAMDFLHGKEGRVCWVKAGSGKSLKLLKAGQVDVVMVHAPKAEKKAVAEGWATDRKLIGMNEFYLVGPRDDPAGVAKAGSVADAYKRIARAKAMFFSRGDNSGTHKKEMAIWKKAGVQPQGAWYVTTGDFMMASLKMADARGGYFMTDSSTYVAAKKDLKTAVVLFSGDPFIINTYHALRAPEAKSQAGRMARDFIAYVAGPRGQKVIGTYGKESYKLPMYGDAAAAAEYDH